MSIPTDLSLKSLYQKVSLAAKVIESIPDMFDREVDDEDGNVLVFSEEYIWSRLEKLGIYKTEDSHEILVSDDCVEGDARRHFCENGEPNLPVTRFKRVWRILKGSEGEEVKQEVSPQKTEQSSELSGLVESMKPIGQWKDDRLLSEYGPECSSDIEEELKKRAKGRAFVVFSDEAAHEINQELTIRFLRNARRMDNPKAYILDNKMFRLYKVGEFPQLVYNTCPLHPAQVLMDGYCDQCGTVWNGIAEETQIFIRVMLEEGEEPTSKFEIIQLNIAAKNGVEALKVIFPKVGILYDERKAEEKLPSLKVRNSVDSCDTWNSVRRMDPFNAGKNKRH